jgi:hypothetical protein
LKNVIGRRESQFEEVQQCGIGWHRLEFVCRKHTIAGTTQHKNGPHAPSVSPLSLLTSSSADGLIQAIDHMVFKRIGERFG